MGLTDTGKSAVIFEPPSESGVKPEIPADVRAKWQRRVDLLAAFTGIPVALIMRAHRDALEVFIASRSPENPYKPHERAELGTGLYCETVLSTRECLRVPDARLDPRFDANPDLKLGLVSYLGMPLSWPDETLFGTMCLLDREPREFPKQTEALIEEVRESVETDLRLLYHLAQRRRAEVALREGEQRLRHVVRDMPVMLSALDENDLIVLWNSECERVTGYTAEEIVRNPLAMDMLYPDRAYLDRMLGEWKNRTGEYRGWEWEIVCKDGSRRTIAWSSVSDRVRIPGWGSWGIGVDITEQQAAAEALRYRLNFEALIASLSNTFIDLPDEDMDAGIRHALAEIGTFVGVDRSYVYRFSDDGERMSNTHEWCAEGVESMRHRIQDTPVSTFPWFAEQILASQVFHVPSRAALPPEAAAERREFEAQSLQSVVCVPIIRSKRVIGFVGFESVRSERSWPEDAIALLKIVGEMIGSAMEHQRVLSSLLESRRALSTLLSNLPGMAYRCRNDRDWTMEFVSEGCLALTGYRVDQLTGDFTVTFGDLIHADDCELVWRRVQQALKDHRPFTLAYRIHTASGEIKWVWEQGQGIFDESGALRALEGFISDITERKRAEEAVQDSERKLRQIIDLVPHFIFAKDAEGRFILANKAVAEAYGTTVDELTGTQESVVNKSPEEIEHFRRDDLEVIRSGAQKVIQEETLVDAAGRRRVLTTTKIPFTVSGSAETAVLGVAVDVTERKDAEEQRARLEEQLRQSQKLEAIGTLASGVAHDFNNMITVILGSTELLKRKVKQVPGAPDALDMIERAVEQATGLTKSLLTFSRKVPAEKRNLDLCEAVRSAVTLVRRALPATIELLTEIPEDEPIRVRADATQVQQVLLNLTINARDAMPDGGTLRLTVRGPAAPGATGDEGLASVTVTDTGTGIPPEIAARIFEPFYTTKARGQGTGLGLSLVDSIVKNHGGRVELDSTPGKGSAFTVLLPSESGQALPTPVNPGDPIPAARGEAILLAEDNEQVRRLVAGMLTAGGYTVIEAKDGLELIETFQRERERIRLMVLDVDLPRRNGVDCLRILRTAGVETPAIIITGTSDISVESKLPHGARLLRKPFHPDDLLALAAQSLSRAP